MSDEDDAEFWAEHDPYDERFAKRIQVRWGCLLAVTVLVGLVFLMFKFGFFMHGD